MRESKSSFIKWSSRSVMKPFPYRENFPLEIQRDSRKPSLEFSQTCIWELNFRNNALRCTTFTSDTVKSVQSTLSHLICQMLTSVPRTIFTRFFEEHGLFQYYLY